jgi:hypothetical protein
VLWTQHNPVRIADDASIEELRAEVMKHLERLAPVLDLEALMVPADGIANRERPMTLGRHMSKRPPARHRRRSPRRHGFRHD